MISNIKHGIITLFKQLQSMFLQTFDFKGKTTLRDSVYALAFQFVIMMMTLITFLMRLVMLFDFNLFLVFLIYVMISLIPTLSLMTRRLRDTNTNPLNLLYLPLSYLLMIAIGVTTMFVEYLSIRIMLILIIFFLSHFYMIILLLLPTVKNPQD